MGTEQNYNRRWVFWLKFFLILAVAVFVLLAGFFVFKVHSEGRMALREAKNVRLALVTADIEMYGAGKTIYSPETATGLADGVMEAVERYSGVSEGVTLLSYDRETREVRMFTYKTPHYMITYILTDSGEEWFVDYLWRIFVY